MNTLKSAGVFGTVAALVVNKGWPLLFHGEAAPSAAYAIAIVIGASLGPKLSFYARAFELAIHLRLGWISANRFRRLMAATHKASFAEGRTRYAAREGDAADATEQRASPKKVLRR